MKNFILAICLLCISMVYGQDSNTKKLIKAAEGGDVKAQTELADLYYKGKGGLKRSFQEGFKWYLKAAEAGDLQAQGQVAEIYFTGRGAPKSPEKGVEWLTKVAESGDARAKRQLALCYKEGKGVEASNAQYIRWIAEVAENEKPEVQMDLAKAYYNGDGVQKDINKAKYWAEKAKKQGYAEADYLIGTWLYEVNPSNPEAIDRLTKAADKDNAEAEYNLSEAYLAGKGVAQSDETALKWLEKAAKGGSAEAEYKLATYYFTGENSLIGKSYKKAFEWFQKAAQKGNAEAQFQLAVCYYNGIGVKQSYQDAFNWISKAVASKATPIAENNLGVIYTTGHGAKASNAQALELFEKAANTGDAMAQYNAGVSLLDPQQLDVKKAFDYLEKSAAQNNLLALKKLGDLYFTGKYTNQSAERAFEYYTKVSKLTPKAQEQMLKYFYQQEKEHYAEALFSLAQCYADGKGVKKSTVQACNLAIKAANLDNKAAFDWLNKRVEKNDPKESADVQLAVADGYYYAKLVRKQNDKAFPIYDKLAKQQDNLTAQKRLIEYYFDAKNPDKSDEKALYWAEKVAKKGDVETQRLLGMYYMKEVPDVKKAPAAPAPKPVAAKPAPKKAKTTPVAATASTTTEPIEIQRETDPVRAELLRRQRGGKPALEVQAHPKKAVQPQRQVVRQAPKAVAPAAPKAAEAPKGPMKRINETKGLFWLSKAAEHNDEEALDALGSYFYNKKDFTQALNNFQRAARRDYAPAQFNLANCYYNGNGVERSFEKAAIYYKQAARRDYAPAQFRLGHCYYHGEGIVQSDNRAADWFDKACDAGVAKSCEMLKIVNKR